MANYRVSGSDLASIADAIRTKGGTSEELFFPDGFVNGIRNIPTGTTLTTKSITENGTYNASSDNADGYSSVTVNVPQSQSPFIKIATYTVEESWENDKTALWMVNNILSGYDHTNVIAYLLVFNNNTSISSYRIDAAICSNDPTNGLGFAFRNYYASTVALNSSCKATAGTTIDIYRALHS